MAKKMASSRAAKNGHDGVAWGYVCGRSGEDVGSLGRSHWESWWFRLPNEQKHGIQMAHSRERPCSLNAVSHIIPMPAIIYDIYVVHSNYQNYTYKNYIYIFTIDASTTYVDALWDSAWTLCVDPNWPAHGLVSSLGPQFQRSWREQLKRSAWSEAGGNEVRALESLPFSEKLSATTHTLAIHTSGTVGKTNCLHTRLFWKHQVVCACQLGLQSKSLDWSRTYTCIHT